MVEDGLAEMDDLLRECIASLRLDRERVQAALARATADAAATVTVSPEMVERFARIMLERIQSGEVRPGRRISRRRSIGSKSSTTQSASSETRRPLSRRSSRIRRNPRKRFALL
jgi:hypothetical protein